MAQHLGTCAWCRKRVRSYTEGLLDICFAGIIVYHRGRCARMLRQAYLKGTRIQRSRGVVLRVRKK